MVDVLCYEDLDAFGTDIDDPLQELEQDVVHMLFEEPEENIDDPNRGIGLKGKLSAPFDPTLGRHIAVQLQKDDRIDVAHVQITPGDAAGEYDIELDIEADGDVLNIVFERDSDGSFRRIS